MALQAGIGAHGLWSISRGLARGIESTGTYKRMMDDADSPRRGDLDGLGNLHRGEIARGEVTVITGLRERTARTLLADLLKLGILDSVSEKGAVFLHFPMEYRDVLSPRLFPDA